CSRWPRCTACRTPWSARRVGRGPCPPAGRAGSNRPRAGSCRRPAPSSWVASGCLLTFDLVHGRRRRRTAARGVGAGWVLELRHLAELELDRGLPAEDVDQHLELELVL